MDENALATRIIGCAIEVHREMGPGLLESIYEECLVKELRDAGLSVQQQVPLPVIFKGVRLENSLRLDIWVEGRVIVEVKAVECFTDVHMAQLMTYLRITDNKLGLLINCNVKLLKQGIKRVALGLR
ncbi:MAG: GxxExxY protein [Flavobacteriales bacterium]